MNFGLIGAGQIGRVRERAIRRAAGCELIAVSDADAARPGSLAASAQAAVCTNYEELLRREDVDAVIISTPPDSHERIAIAALEAGKHVLCEKPLAPNPGACRRMLDAAGGARRTLATGFCQRYFPAIQFVKETVASGRIGEISYVRAFTGHAGLAEFSEPWVHNKEVVGGGALMDKAFSNPRMSLKSVRAEKGRLQGEDLLSERIEGFERGGGQGGGGSCAHSGRDHEGFLELPLPPPLNVESGAVRPR